MYLPGPQGRCGSCAPEPCCHQGNWASFCSQACSRNWDGQLYLPNMPRNQEQDGALPWARTRPVACKEKDASPVPSPAPQCICCGKEPKAQICHSPEAGMCAPFPTSCCGLSGLVLERLKQRLCSFPTLLTSLWPIDTQLKRLSCGRESQASHVD